METEVPAPPGEMEKRELSLFLRMEAGGGERSHGKTDL